MTKIKLNSIAILLLLITSSVFISCLNENNEILSENYRKKGLKYQNKLYVANNQGVTKKYENGIFKYIIIVESKNTTTVETKESIAKNSEFDELIIRNDDTDEFIEVLNIQKHENFYTFDVVNNLGDTMNNLTYYGEMFPDDVNSRCPMCWALGLVGIIIDAFTDSSLEECTAAMNALNCANGSPFMVFSEGWFSTSCEVGCVTNEE